uniref:Uncharacterized protein n=1 Tax=Parascaris univalens TaxID=6257 RepID=A0A915A2N2_PARUN
MFEIFFSSGVLFMIFLNCDSRYLLTSRFITVIYTTPFYLSLLPQNVKFAIKLSISRVNFLMVISSMTSVHIHVFHWPKLMKTCTFCISPVH